VKAATFIAALLAATLSPAGLANPSEDVVAGVQARAAEAGFDGAILVGEADGSSRVLTFGKHPVNPEAVWRWASITKQLSAVLAMQEVAAGKLDLDAPVSRYWPEWKSPNADSVRIRDLMLHNSGLPQPDESAPDKDGVPGFYRAAAVAPADSANGFCAGPPAAKAPASFNYNNCDSIVLGEVLARVTGKPFEQLLEQRIAQPLALKSLGMFHVGEPAKGHVLPTGEFANVDGMLNLGVYGASGGAYGTIADLWTFDRALLDGRLLPREQSEIMWKAVRANGFYGFFQWVYPSRLRGCPVPVRIVERQGLVGGIELRNYILPESGRALIMFSRHRPTNLGDPWEGKGFAFDLLSTVECR
jgi:D-alanyl-D-alanine carboxypeptidase